MTFTPPFEVPPGATVVFDTETDGTDWKTNKVVGYVVTIGPEPHQSAYLPVRHAGGGNLDPKAVEAWINSWAFGDEITLIGHYLKFDLHMAANHNVVFNTRKLHCTMVNHALIDEHSRYSLDFICKYYGTPNKSGDALYEYLAGKYGCEANKDSMEHFHKLAGDDPMAVEYAEQDGTATWAVHHAQQQYLIDDGLEEVAALESRVLRTLFRMERRGIKVDFERAHDFHDEIQRTYYAAKAKLPDDLNVRSCKQLPEFLRAAGITNIPTTEKGNPSCTEHFLKTFPLGQQILDVRKSKNLLDTFLDPLLHEHLHEGRVHCTFNQTMMDEHGTVSGRLSCSGPNMQQVPKRNPELAPGFRAIFRADPGMLWSTNDYSQQEYVLFAWYARAEAILAGYRAEPPVDMHTTVSEMVTRPREQAKTTNFLVLYGGGVKALAEQLGISLMDAMTVMNEYNVMVPEVSTFKRRAEQAARTRGWVKTILGRRARFPDLRFVYKAPNRIIQGSCADITKLKMCEVDEYFEEQGDICHLLLQVHDDLNWQYPDRPEGHLQNEQAQRIMMSFESGEKIELDVPLRVDSHAAEHWGAASFPDIDWGK